MKRLLRCILHLYPRQWRRRYGAELDALIDDTGGLGQDLPDILLEALKMRLTTLNWRFAGAFALAGLAIGAAISFRIPDRYVSTAVLKTSPGPNADEAALARQTQALVDEVLSRTSLSRLIQAPEHPLYADARRRQPLETVIRDMKANDLNIGFAPTTGAITISFVGRSPEEARTIVRTLSSRLIDEHQQRQLNLALLSKGQLFEPSVAAKLAVGSRMEIVNPPALLRDPIYPNRPVVAAAGLLAGLAAALIFFVFRRNPRAWLLTGIALTLSSFTLNLLPILYEDHWSADGDGSNMQPSPTRNLLPILSYQSEATLIFDSPATITSLLQDKVHLTRGIDDPERSGLEFLARQDHLTIRGHQRNRFKAQRAVQLAITNMFDSLQVDRSGVDPRTWQLNGPWGEVVDPPSLPVVPQGQVWFERIIIAGLIVSATAGAILLFNRRRPTPPTLQPA